MKIKIIILVLIAVFSVSAIAGAAWKEDPANVETMKASGKHHGFFWLKLLLRLLHLEKRVTDLEESTVALQGEIDAEAMERQAADEQLQGNIDEEAATRRKKDRKLRKKINAEAIEREAVDDLLQNNIDIEANEREAADEDLQEQIDSIETGAVEVPILFSSGAEEIVPTANWRMGVGFLSFRSDFGVIMPMSGKIKNLVGYSLNSPASDDPGSFTFTVYVNRIATDVSCVVTSLDPCEDLVNSVDVKRLDKVAIGVRASEKANISLVGASVMLEKSDSDGDSVAALEPQ